MSEETDKRWELTPEWFQMLESLEQMDHGTSWLRGFGVGCCVGVLFMVALVHIVLF